MSIVTEPSPDKPLSLKPDLSVIPYDNGNALLFLEGGTSLIVGSPDLDIMPVLATLLRGTTEEELVKLAAPGVSHVEAREAVIELISLLDKADALLLSVHEHDLSESEIQRFASVIFHLARYETTGRSRFDMFRRLRKAHVLMIGGGGMGSALLPHLVASGVGQITMFDPDMVKESNLARQTMYGFSDIGRQKVEVAADTVARLSEFTQFEGVAQSINSTEQLVSALSERPGVDLIIQSADTPIWSLTKWIASAAQESGIPSLHSSYLGVGPLFIPGRSACPACLLPKVEAEVRNHKQVVQFQTELAANGVPRAVLSTSLVQYGALLANEAVMYLSGAMIPRSIGSLIRVYANGDPSTIRTEIDRDPRCSVCGSGSNNFS